VLKWKGEQFLLLYALQHGLGELEEILDRHPQHVLTLRPATAMTASGDTRRQLEGSLFRFRFIALPGVSVWSR
jgi:hypothetical protein